MSSKQPKPIKKKKGCGYSMAQDFPPGEIITKNKTSWCLQAAIGKGGFGKIYSATQIGDSNKTPTFAVKVEPKENGPLFCEQNIYLRLGKPEDIEEFKQAKKLKHLGMPTYFGFGTHLYKEVAYRYLIMPRFGKDIWSIFQENKNFPVAVSYQIGIQVLNVLEYFHSKGYVHMDVKGSNLLLGFTKGTENQVYLVDFGLACKFVNERKPDPKKAHNGTIEYLSRDAHEGIPTTRGDVEVLGYNLLHWIASSLPWEKLKNHVDVQSQKVLYMSDVETLVKKCSSKQNIPLSLVQFLKEINKLSIEILPNHDKLRSILSEELKKLGVKQDGKLEFVAKKTPRSVKGPSKLVKESPLGKRGKTKIDFNNEKVRTPKTSKASSSKAVEEVFHSDQEEEVVPKKKKTVKKVLELSDVSAEELPSSSDQELKVVPIKKKTVKRAVPPQKPSNSKSSKEVHRHSSDQEDDELIPKRVKRSTTQKSSSKVSYGLSTDEESEEEAPGRRKPVRKVLKETNVKVSKGNKGEKDKIVKRSWRDCPTIVNSVGIPADQDKLKHKPKK